MIWLYIFLALVVLSICFNLRVKQVDAHYEQLVEKSMPKTGTWTEAGVIHDLSRTYEPKSDRGSIVLALQRLEKKGLVESTIMMANGKLSLDPSGCWRWKVQEGTFTVAA